MNRLCIIRIVFFVLISVFSLYPAVQADFRLPQNIIMQSEVDYPTCAYAADLDGDGDLDVLSSSANDDKIAWYENDGSGQFGPQQVITSSANWANSIYAADLDGDGDLDVLSASYSMIAWYENDGYGQFDSAQGIASFPDLSNIKSIYAADLDGDSDLDVLSASSEDKKIAWYENDGSGRFGSQQVITNEADGANSVYASDLDSDGDLDVLSSSSLFSLDGKIAWYENDGSGQFGSQQLIMVEGDGANSVYASDLDGDGDLDLLSSSSSFLEVNYVGMIAWYENDGSGQFGPQQVINTFEDSVNYVYAADLDGDGDLDILSASSGDDKIAWYENDGSGRFGSSQVITKNSVSGANSVFAADLDSDGDLDVLSSSYYDDKLAWYENEGTGQFGPPQVFSNSVAANSVCSADLDDDGDLDVLLSSYGSGIAWYENDGTGQFGGQMKIETGTDRPRFVCAADLDGDGDLDVLSASSHQIMVDGFIISVPGIIAWHRNSGPGQFGSKQVISTEVDGACSSYAADLDGDGDIDVISASSTNIENGMIAWYANDGSGRFGSQQVICGEANGAKAVYAADLDGDGDLDVLSASSGDDKIAWYENEGAGRFVSRRVIYAKANGATSVYAADLDGDGDLDVLSAGDIKIAWYENE